MIFRKHVKHNNGSVDGCMQLYKILYKIKNMKKIDGDVIGAIIFLLCILAILVAILFVFWVKISPWLTISLVAILVFLLMNSE